MDRRAWRATVHGVIKSRTGLKRLSTHARTLAVLLVLSCCCSFIFAKAIALGLGGGGGSLKAIWQMEAEVSTQKALLSH